MEQQWQADTFLHNLALHEYLSKFPSRFCHIKVPTDCCYQDVAGPVVTVMQVVWPQCSEKIEGKGHGTFERARFSLMHANHCLSHESVEPVNRFCSNLCSKAPDQEPGSQIVTASDYCDPAAFKFYRDYDNHSFLDSQFSEVGDSDCSESMHDLSHCFDQNGQVISCDLQFDEEALFSAAKGGFTDVIRDLLERKADVNANDRVGRRGTPLHVAVEYGHSDVVRLLIEGRANVNSVSQLRHPPLFTACENGHLLIASLLVDAKADVNQRTNFHGIAFVPIFSAFGLGSDYDHDLRFPIIRLLIEAKADVNAHLEPFDDGQQQDAFDAAGSRVEEEWEGLPRRQFIVRQKSDVRDKGEPVWYKGIRCFDVNSGKERVSASPAGASAELEFNVNCSMLHCSVAAKQPQLCSLLISAKADLNALSSQTHDDISMMCSPLALAVLGDVDDCIRLLIDAKSDPNTHVLFRSGQLADANESNIEKSVSILELYIGINNGNQQVVQLLLDAQAEPNP